ncbi:uncharacterized protein LOC115664753 [Syzygium oleosum]|uniref:uncharacterized protein LOC115664753 n=1 Tax=Syzygium oleosum TaxID=219896 RepID=UPI0011D29378|nr:uncharacterized protein LOC115664753 [Syzygium oleosum]
MFSFFSLFSGSELCIVDACAPDVSWRSHGSYRCVCSTRSPGARCTSARKEESNSPKAWRLIGKQHSSWSRWSEGRLTSILPNIISRYGAEHGAQIAAMNNHHLDSMEESLFQAIKDNTSLVNIARLLLY